MQLPGFNAEASLASPSQRYAAERRETDAARGSSIVPQAIRVCRCPCCIQVGSNLVCCD